MDPKFLTVNIADDPYFFWTWTAQNSERIPNPKIVPSGNLDAILVEQLELLLVSCYGHPEKCDCAFCSRMLRVKHILMEIFE